MNLANNIHPNILAMLTAHEAFMRLGFKPDDLFVTAGIDPRYSRATPQVSVMLRKDGLEFRFRICNLWTTVADLEKEWPFAVACWNDPSSTTYRKEAWQISESRQRITEIIAALLRKGFVLPGVEEGAFDA